MSQGLRAKMAANQPDVVHLLLVIDQDLLGRWVNAFKTFDS